MAEWGDFEPERYELREPAPYRFEADRREFLALAGGGLLLFTTGASGQRPGGQGEADLSARLHMAADGTITVFTSKVEVGQGSRTQLTQAAAEELGISPEKIRLVMADTDLVPDDGGTAGSRTTPSTVPAVRRAAAAAKKILAATAANPKATMDQLRGAIPSDVVVKPAGDWQHLGKTLPKVDSRAIVTGAHKYPADITRPGMLYGKVLRAPVYNAKLEELDKAAASKLAGVVIVHDGEFAGCTAPTSWEAKKGIEALAAGAKYSRKPHVSSKKLFEHLKATARTGSAAGRGSGPERTKGDASAAMASAANTLKASFEVAYVQHAPMEPRAAVAEWEGDKLTVWTGTQMPHRVRQQLAEAFRVPQEKVRVMVPDTGGGFGGKHTGETAIEAARLAKAAGKPVSLRWTRAEEFAWAYFRPAGLFEIQAGFDGNGKLTAWDYTNYNAGGAGLDTPYAVANSRIRFLYTDSPLREGSYRGIAATANNFARELFMDELAEAAKMDPLRFRLLNLDNPRLRAVLESAAERFRFAERWKSRKAGTGVGIACGTEKGSYIACCAEVGIREGEIEVREVTQVFECGAIQNPRNLRAQVDGCLIQGLGAALWEEAIFEDGKLMNGRFASYRVPRMSDVPKLDTHLLDRRDLTSAGAGETPIIAIAPAVAAAVHHAGYARVRSMPVRLAGA
ncbi:MAG: isoquinoline 1-oxidoreductase [Acidimicrobiia bacterium]|nr:isoquinoline 1-oxidoreductase [Acidimicrobiia bacterium]